jgi:ABC-type nickel/cobalt efflux system permease component RcnA
MFADVKGKPFSGKFLYYLLVCFIYGIFHALGPGHAKTLVSSYVMGSKMNLRQTTLFGAMVAGGHAISAFTLVVIFYYIVKTPIMAGFDTSTSFLTKTAYSIVLCIGLFMLFKKVFGKGHSHGDDKGKGFFLSALAVGIIPCPGAMVLTIFAVTSGTVLAGFISVVSMAFGMAVTIVSVSAITYYFRTFGENLDSRSHIKIHSVMEFAGIFILIAFSSFMLI